ncbi:hypothetical protein Q1695_003207 [Nippostrongylus brasiliensis]|nr:hypothetical protein Q1695_003207 [Nippostrongylus brasiliensis]
MDEHAQTAKCQEIAPHDGGQQKSDNEGVKDETAIGESQQMSQEHGEKTAVQTDTYRRYSEEEPPNSSNSHKKSANILTNDLAPEQRDCAGQDAFQAPEMTTQREHEKNKEGLEEEGINKALQLQTSKLTNVKVLEPESRQASSRRLGGEYSRSGVGNTAEIQRAQPTINDVNSFQYIFKRISRQLDYFHYEALYFRRNLLRTHY